MSSALALLEVSSTHRSGRAGIREGPGPVYPLVIEDDRLYVDLTSATKRRKKAKVPHPSPVRSCAPRVPIRVLGIATTAMTTVSPRYSASDALLEAALEHARGQLQLDTQLIRLRDLSFRPCEGFYSKAAEACTWPCSITQMDAADQMDPSVWGHRPLGGRDSRVDPDQVGRASSLYYKMVERLNCIQNQRDDCEPASAQDKVAAFIIMGGQDNAGRGRTIDDLFAEVGCQFPQFPLSPTPVVGVRKTWNGTIGRCKAVASCAKGRKRSSPAQQTWPGSCLKRA